MRTAAPGSVVARSYGDVGKDHIVARTYTILPHSTERLRRRDAKALACAEFDGFVAEQRNIAVAQAVALKGPEE